jgi:hypothetical protein
MANMDKKRLDKLLHEAAWIIENAADSEIPELLGEGIVDKLLLAIAPQKSNSEQTIYDYLLANKRRLQLVALVRHAINHNYSTHATVNGRPCFVSPEIRQWFEDGVMFLQGNEPFGGLIGRYQNSQVAFAVAARDIRVGDHIGPDGVLFLSIDELRQAESEKVVPTSLNDLDSALNELGGMLERREEDEAKYHLFFTRNAWILGLQYSKIDSHKSLDDKNIPDFTGVRARDKARDIIEIKQPFLPIFCQDGTFRAEFYRAWQQTENYLEFVLSNEDYLYNRKGLRFDNPLCFLLLGHDLSNDEAIALLRKQKMNARITILTYNDVMALGRSTAQFIKAMGGRTPQPS